jgi:hypothetical protein
MRISFNIDINDLIAYSSYQSIDNKKLKTNITRNIIIYISIYSIWLLLFYYRIRKANDIYDIVFVLVPMIFLLLTSIFSKQINKIRTKIKYNNKKYNIFIGKHILTLYNNEIIENYNGNDIKKNINQYFRLIYKDNYIYIVYAPEQAHIINKNKVITGNLNNFMNHVEKQFRKNRISIVNG